MAETIVLALEGRFEVFTVGRDTEWEKVKVIYKLGLKHGMKLAAISGVNGPFSDEAIAKVVTLAKKARLTWNGGSAAPAKAAPKNAAAAPSAAPKATTKKAVDKTTPPAPPAAAKKTATKVAAPKTSAAKAPAKKVAANKAPAAEGQSA